MKWNNIKTTIFKELRGIVRDKKSMSTIIYMPLIIPIFVLLMGFMFDVIGNTDYNIGVNYELTTEEKTTTNTTYISLGKWVDSKEALGEYTYNIETRTLYKYKTRTTSSSEEYTWATEKPDGYEPTGRSRTKFIPNRRNVQK